MNIGKKIKVLILLAVMFTVCFPIQEFFHDHAFASNLCETTEHIKEDCGHKSHITEKENIDFCFLLHISKHFQTADFSFYSFRTLHSYIYQFLLVENFEFQIVNLFLRGPPLNI